MAELRGRDSDVSQLTQATLAQLMARGDLDRHVRRVRVAHRKRRDHLLAALHGAIERPDVRGVAAGLHLTLVLPAHVDEGDVVTAAIQDHRLALWGLRQHYRGSAALGGLVLGFSRTATGFDDSVARLVRILRQHGVGSPGRRSTRGSGG